MIRSLVLALITCLSTIGGLYGAMTWKAAAKATSADGEHEQYQMMRTRMVSVPLLLNGEVLGYIVTRLQFLAETSLLKGSTVQPEAFVADEAFRQIYEKAPEDMKSGRKQVINELANSVAAGANKRMGRDVVKDVMIDSWAYLSKQDMMSKL
ncbi:MAG: flagellar basal body-associated protein FliL [Proteobacteria bacterium]|nr:flagellar basal body-associated protein FliL [Pseudomonadota bacterium]